MKNTAPSYDDISNPQVFSDFRPICVTSAHSRLTEKLLVPCWLRPALSTLDLRDQFTFRSTGSTNYALIIVLIASLECWNVTDMLDVCS